MLVGLLLGSSPLVAQAAEDMKIGYVDLQRAMSETEDGRKAKASLQKVFDQKQKELNEQQEDLKKEMQDFDKKRSLLTPDKISQKEKELQERAQKLQQTYLRHQQDIQQREQEATGKIVERMNRILNKIASSENFTMIFDRAAGGVVFAKPHLDLTNDLIRRYNAGEGADAKAPGAPAAAPTAAPAPAKK
jgi:outer membrane protein